jgi:hypothetical protein
MSGTFGTVRRLLRVMLAVVILGGTLLIAAPASVVQARDGFTLTSLCTPSQDFPAFRRFRINNANTFTARATVRNRDNGQSVTVDAAPGQTFVNVPAGPGSNTTQLIVNGDVKDTKAANNRACSSLRGLATCNSTTGRFDIAWTLINNNTGALTILETSIPGLVFSPTQVPGNGTATARESVPGPASTTVDRELIVTVDLGAQVIGRPAATVTLGECRPPLPPKVEFTFTKTPSVTQAAVGDTVTYTYAGRNTGDVALEIVQLVDDRLGVVIRDPDVTTIVRPGESISRAVPYVVTANDLAIGTITNAAVVTVLPQYSGATPLSATANASVQVLGPPPPEASLEGDAVCRGTGGFFDVTWTLRNTGTVDAVLPGSNRPGILASGTVAPGASLGATEAIVAPADGTVSVTLDVAVQNGGTESATVVLGECVDQNPPVATFTFTKTASVARALTGDVITYTYSGRNSGTVALEVVQLVDDQLGVVLQDPNVRTVVQPGETISRSVTYTVTDADASNGVIENVAIVTVIAPGDRRLSASATARVTAGPREESGVTPPPPPGGGGELPTTGGDPLVLLLAASVVLVVGLALTRSGRRVLSSE